MPQRPGEACPAPGEEVRHTAPGPNLYTNDVLAERNADNLPQTCPSILVFCRGPLAIHMHISRARGKRPHKNYIPNAHLRKPVAIYLSNSNMGFGSHSVSCAYVARRREKEKKGKKKQPGIIYRHLKSLYVE